MSHLPLARPRTSIKNLTVIPGGNRRRTHEERDVVSFLELGGRDRDLAVEVLKMASCKAVYRLMI